MSSQEFTREPESSGGIVPEWMRDPSKFQRQLMIIVLSLILIRLAIYFLVEFAAIFQPLLLAIFICYLILPIHHGIVRMGAPSKVAFIILFLLIMGLFYGVGVVIYGNVRTIEDNWDSKYNAGIQQLATTIDKQVKTWFPQATMDFRKLLDVPTQEEIERIINGVVGTFLSFFTWLLVILVYVIFLVTEREDFPKRVESAFGESRSTEVSEVLKSINSAIAQYFSTKTALSIVTALLTMAVLLVPFWKVDFVLTWGLLTFLFNYIPYIGSVIAGAFPVLLCFITYPTELWKGFVVAVCLFTIQQVIGNYVEPRLMGKKLHLSPLLIIIALSFWGVIWGIIGMILAVPLLIIVQIVLSHIKETKPIAILMSSE